MKAIIFDMGGVLVDLDAEGCRRAFKEEMEFDEIDQLLDPCHQKGIIGDMEAGQVSSDEFREYVLARSKPGCKPEDVDKAFGTILLGIAPYKIDLLKRLSEDHDIYMLSNNNPIATVLAEKMFEQAGFSMKTGFRKCYMSYRMKMIKPSEEFFRAVMEDIGLPADEMLFIDDSRLNVEAALKVGLPAVYYEPGTDLSKIFE